MLLSGDVYRGELFRLTQDLTQDIKMDYNECKGIIVTEEGAIRRKQLQTYDDAGRLDQRYLKASYFKESL